jgi:hypothetical protein
MKVKLNLNFPTFRNRVILAPEKDLPKLSFEVFSLTIFHFIEIWSAFKL